jgi:CMP-N,N'-diacetyllegionaminic acid synthase
MIGGKKLLAVIPARGGSKRLPRKNILDLAGKPLIAWTIEAALGSKYIDRVIVSTDDKEIATISKKYGADVPFMRPSELATDEAKSVDVVLHLLEKLKKIREKYDYIILLQPTSPLRTTQNIDDSVELLQARKSDAVISVCKVEHSPLWCNLIPDDDLSNFLDHSILNKRSQDLEQYYRLNGAIYLCNAEKLKEEKAFFLKNRCSAYKMNRESSVDIDSRMDFLYASVCINNGI